MYNRDALEVDKVLVGPAIVEEPGSTTVVPQGHAASIDSNGSLHISYAHAIAEKMA